MGTDSVCNRVTHMGTHPVPESECVECIAERESVFPLRTESLSLSVIVKTRTEAIDKARQIGREWFGDHPFHVDLSVGPYLSSANGMPTSFEACVTIEPMTAVVPA
jgi:hypothetical protein